MNMGLLGKVSGVGTAFTVWKSVRGGLERPSSVWFGQRFVAAASVVVDRWGPRWARRRIAGAAPVGAWLLLALWLGAWLGATLFLLRKFW